MTQTYRALIEGAEERRKEPGVPDDMDELRARRDAVWCDEHEKWRDRCKPEPAHTKPYNGQLVREATPPVVPLADVLDLLEKRAQIEAPNAAAALRWTAKLAVQKWGQP